MMVCFRRGTAKNTPKKATPSDHNISWGKDNMIAPSGSSALLNNANAGMTPTKPKKANVCVSDTQKPYLLSNNAYYLQQEAW
jgi:hypothetical protein